MAYTFFLVDGSEAATERRDKLLALAGPGGEALLASSGPAGLALLDDLQLRPSLILAGFAMDGMNVIEFLGAVRMRRWLEGVPVAVCANAIADREMMACYRLGVCAVLVEPLSRHELKSVIAEWARPSHRGSDGATPRLPDQATHRRVA
ncbi:MAG: hypothetical protein HUU14_12155 [Dehalococcoidia bacterium]|nr:MAG: response regulator [bacterium]MCE7927717.1 response regulator [Chloroflexi bacterium CFX7]MCK6565032.1 hypothetical protein [Dehalococcoidia bacterium]MCL4231713.1 hypothetical protein [Dehalococcoidia bacterium]NUQ56632.1 hypothetical protein [Dehalococcoidia bacterium]